MRSYEPRIIATRFSKVRVDSGIRPAARRGEMNSSDSTLQWTRLGLTIHIEILGHGVS